MDEEIDVVVVGAGQAGLAVSHELTQVGVAHVVLESDRVAAGWRGRWDSFCLVTPNDTILLPGGEYAGGDPHGCLPRDGVVAHLERYAARFGAPVRAGVQVRSLRPSADGTLRLDTGDGTITARAVVAATGAFQRPYRPAWAAALPSWLTVLDSRPGCQIAEELHLAGRDVVLACGRAPWAPRQIEGRDLVYWMLEANLMEAPVSDLPSGGRPGRTRERRGWRVGVLCRRSG